MPKGLRLDPPTDLKVGSIRLRRKPNVWELRLYLGRDENGKVIHKYATFVGGKRNAEKELARFSFELESQPKSEIETSLKWNAETTFNGAISVWRENGWRDLSPKTVINYEGCYNRYIKASIGKNAIARTGVFEIESYFRSLADNGLGLATLKYIRAVLVKAAALAGKWSGGAIPNPVSLADLPKIAPKAPVRAPSVDEVRKILEKLDQREDIKLAGLIRVLAATGMRSGEAVALRWADISLEDRLIQVNKAAITAKGALLVKSPKTHASVRTIAIDAHTVEKLKSLKQTQANFALKAGLSLSEEAFAFSYFPDGSMPPHPDTISHRFKTAAEACGISDIHVHSLRDFQATVIDSLVSERQKQARLGWSTSHMARHYTDAVAEEDRRAAEEIGNILN